MAPTAGVVKTTSPICRKRIRSSFIESGDLVIG
jgi:hypothetical protein